MTLSKADFYKNTKNTSPYIFVGLIDLKKGRRLVIQKSPVVDIIKGLLPKYYGVTFEDINTSSRQLEICYIKHHFISLVRETTIISLKSIGAIFDYKEGGVDHSTVINSITAWNNLLSYDVNKQQIHAEFKNEIKQIKALAEKEKQHLV